MTAQILNVTDNPDGGRTYAIDAGGPKLIIELYPGDPSFGEHAWRAEVTFVSAEEIISGEGGTRRAALLAAASREETVARNGTPLPVVVWGEVERALEGAGAF